MVVTSSGRHSILIDTGSESFLVDTIRRVQSLGVNLMCSSRLGRKEATLSMAKGYISPYHKADSNSSLMRVPRREVDGPFLSRIQLPRYIMSSSVRSVLGLRVLSAVSRGLAPI